VKFRHTAAMAAVTVAALAAPSAQAADFYETPSPLPGKKHGDLLRSKKLPGSAALAGATNSLVLYRSTGLDGLPIAVSGTVSVPKGKAPKGGWPVITYAHGSTGIGDDCAPSKDSETSPVHLYNAYVYPVLERWLKAGYAVVRTDYEGLGTAGVHPYLVGTSEGRGVLDIVRAARKLNKRLSRRVIIAGHSQGGHAALWAAFLAPTYTKDLDVRGTIAYAPASHMSEQGVFLPALTIKGGLSGLIAMIVRGIDVARPAANVSSLFTDPALALYPETLIKCLPQLGAADSFGALSPKEMFKEGADLGPAQAILDKSDPENLRIKTSVFIAQGASDSTVLPSFTDALDRELRAKGGKITYKSYAGVDHAGIVNIADKDARAYIRKRLR
jgi:pimeloyl-ACP methyl ester carboxylesterase